MNESKHIRKWQSLRLQSRLFKATRGRIIFDWFRPVYFTRFLFVLIFSRACQLSNPLWISKLRLSVHYLEIESGRYGAIDIYWRCSYCRNGPMHEVEEWHVLYNLTLGPNIYTSSKGKRHPHFAVMAKRFFRSETRFWSPECVQVTR